MPIVYASQAARASNSTPPRRNTTTTPTPFDLILSDTELDSSAEQDDDRMDDGDSDSDTIILRTGELSRLRRRGAIAREAKEKEREQEYVLFCGRQLEDKKTKETDRGPFKPSALAWQPLETVSPSTAGATPPAFKPPQSTGCGAIVHMAAYPKTRQGLWTTSSSSHPQATSAVVLYPSYKQSDKANRSGCGCVRETVACSNW